MAPHMVARCDTCAQPFHLNHRTDLPGEDCGQVWLDEEHLGLQFACNSCYAENSSTETLNDILDVSEAAALTGLSEANLVAMAASGGVRYRKTGSGVYLFERGDLLALGTNG